MMLSDTNIISNMSYSTAVVMNTLKSNRCDIPVTLVTNAEYHRGTTTVKQQRTTFLHDGAVLEAMPSMESIMSMMKYRYR